jgi:hypothetical protein
MGYRRLLEWSNKKFGASSLGKKRCGAESDFSPIEAEQALLELKVRISDRLPRQNIQVQALYATRTGFVVKKGFSTGKGTKAFGFS